MSTTNLLQSATGVVARSLRNAIWRHRPARNGHSCECMAQFPTTEERDSHIAAVNDRDILVALRSVLANELERDLAEAPKSPAFSTGWSADERWRTFLHARAQMYRRAADEAAREV